MGTRRIRSFPTVNHPSASHSGTRSSFILHRRCACRRETREVGRRWGGGKGTHTCAHRGKHSVLVDSLMDIQRHHAHPPGGGATPSRVVDKAAPGTDQHRTHTIIAQAQHKRRETMTLCNMQQPFPPSSLLPRVGQTALLPARTQSTCEPNQLRQGLPEAGRLRQDRVDGLMQDRHWKPPTRTGDRCFRIVCSASSNLLPW